MRRTAETRERRHRGVRGHVRAAQHGRPRGAQLGFIDGSRRAASLPCGHLLRARDRPRHRARTATRARAGSRTRTGRNRRIRIAVIRRAACTAHSGSRAGPGDRAANRGIRNRAAHRRPAAPQQMVIR